MCRCIFLHHWQYLLISLPSGMQQNQKFLRSSSTVPTSNLSSILPIPAWLLKTCPSVLITTITDTVDLSLSSGQFHPILKQSTLSPLLKKSTLDKDQPSLSNYARSPTFLRQSQSPYIHSTETSSLTSTTITSLAHRKYPGSVFVISLQPLTPMATIFSSVDSHPGSGFTALL